MIDDILDDDIWKQATVIDDLHRVFPYEYMEPYDPKNFFVIYDGALMSAVNWAEIKNVLTGVFET